MTVAELREALDLLHEGHDDDTVMLLSDGGHPLFTINDIKIDPDYGRVILERILNMENKK
jgi:hypothetical protein